jgi:GNAT superfamily N-acetyltransferase
MDDTAPALDGPRPVRPHEFDAMMELVNGTFRGSTCGDMQQRFPLLFGETGRSYCHVMVDGERPVSHVALLVRDATICGATVKTASVGAVCTDEAYRGHGLASRILDECERALRSEGVDVMLISGNRGLYHRRGARFVGRAKRYEVPLDVLAKFADPALNIRRIGTDDWAVLDQLNSARPIHFVRSESDWLALLAAGRCENHHAAVWLAERDDSPVAYAVHCRERNDGDPCSLACEWAGGPADVLAMLHAATTDADREQVGILAEAVADAGLIECLDPTDVPATTGHLQRIAKVLRPSAFYDKIRAQLPSPANEFAVTDDGEGAVFSLGSESLALPVEDVAPMLFGDSEGEVNERLRSKGTLGETLAADFALALPRYGFNYT